ncbi:TetR family transcriptional regulator [Streptomyces sp. NPDC008125]|uniref:TetR family transcriptional regulator n=1 Tax=Streptomyces sp. NPDC008125 TaxID=3364811 RepID=UPI0036E118B8
MNSPAASHPPSTVADTDRRTTVLDSAMVTFARFGYRKTSMEEVARAADISRPGLYFLFSSKESLFRAAVTQALERDIAAIERVLADTGRPLAERLLDAFDQWAGRYIGPLTRDVAVVIEDNSGLLGEIVETTPQRFEQLITDAIAVDAGQVTARQVAQTMISASTGLKHQAASRDFFLERLEVAIGLLVR